MLHGISMVGHSQRNKGSATQDTQATPPEPKRRRLRACDPCRQRKIRCDNLPGACRNCQTYNDRCVITRDGRSVPRSSKQASQLCINRPNAKRLAANSIQDNTQDEQAGHMSPIASPPLTISTNQHFTDIAGSPQNHTSPVRRDSLLVRHHENISDVSTPRNQDSTAFTFSHRGENNVQGVVTTEVGRFPKVSKFAGITSPQVFAKSAEELFKSSAPHIDVMGFFCPTMRFAEELPLETFDQVPLVDKSLADRCLQRYFSIYHVLFPLFDVRALHDKYEAFYREGRCSEIGPVACIFLAIALGSDDREIADAHFRTACRMHGDLIARPYLPSVQAFILMTLYLMNTGRESQALLHIGIATNIAQSIGLHRSLSAHNHPHEFQFVLKEHSLRICIWWACYCLDKKLSFELGRPSTIYDGDCDADLPDMSQAFTPSTQSIIGTQIPNFFTYFIDLCQRLSNISSRLFSIHTSTLDGKTGISLISNADTLLQDWRASLPEDLVPGHGAFEPKSEIFSIAASLLNCTYLNALVLVHRSSLIGGSRSHYMRSHPDRRIAGSEKICVEAAHTLAHETNNLITEPRTIPVPRWINPYAINSIVAIFIALMRSPRRWSREVDLALLRSMHHCFQNREDPALMGRFESLLDMLIKAVERHSSVDLPTPQMEVGRQNIYQAGTTSWSETPRGGEMHQSGISDFGDTSTTHHERDFQFDDFFGNQWNSWNFQLWPLVPVEEEDGMYMNAPSGAFSV